MTYLGTRQGDWHESNFPAGRGPTIPRSLSRSQAIILSRT